MIRRSLVPLLFALWSIACAHAEESPSASVAAHAAALERGSTREKQQAFAALATLPGAEADRVLHRELDRYERRELPPALWLDLFEAAAQRADPEIKERLAERERRLTSSRDPLQRWRECLEGGDAKAGRAIFAERAEAGCIRCHRMNRIGGEIGPELTGLGLHTERIFILESIVEPNAVISPGFASYLLTLKNGDVLAGVVTLMAVRKSSSTSLADGKRRTIKTADIAERTALPSPMPPALGLVLGKRAIRDLVEYIATSE